MSQMSFKFDEPVIEMIAERYTEAQIFSILERKTRNKNHEYALRADKMAHEAIKLKRKVGGL